MLGNIGSLYIHVSQNILENVHKRLNKIKGYTDAPNVYFGNINILCYGDFHHLCLVCSKSAFDDQKCGIPHIPQFLTSATSELKYKHAAKE